MTPVEVANLSHQIRWASEGAGPIRITSHLVDEVRRGSLPRVDEQMENLLRWTSRKLVGPGHSQEFNYYDGPAVAGAIDAEGFKFVVDALEEAGLVTTLQTNMNVNITPTLSGWLRAADLDRGSSEGRRAFVAMEFDNPLLDALYDRCILPACESTGFQAVRLDKDPEAGLIDIRMRVEIQRARLVIADLTNSNAGAYWEAGYADGLGKPVIYLCQSEFFNEKKTHFDTRNHYTLVWTSEKFDSHSSALADVIRATLPLIAKSS